MRRLSICAVLAALLSAGAALPAGAAGPSRFSEIARLAELQDIGPLAAPVPVPVSVRLAYHHAAELAALVEAQGDPASASYRHFLSRAQFNGYFAPTPSDQNRVVAALRSSGFHVTRTYPNRTIVDATGPASAAEAFFATRIDRVVQAGHGERYINVRPLTVPAALRDVVAGVVGLTNVRTLHADNMRGGSINPFASGSTILGPDGGYGPAAFQGAYDLPGLHGYLGKGQAAGIVIDADYLDSDLASFLKYFNVTRSAKTPTVRISIDGGPPAGLTGDSAETTLDIETIAGLAPQAGIYVYEFPSFEYDAYIVDAYEQLVTDDVVGTANSSFGGCENVSADDFPHTTDALALQGSALGITFHASSGDNGSFGCRSTGVEAPASGPHFLSVGGTELFLKPSTGALQIEIAWAALNGSPQFSGASGGGVSTIFDLPSYQKNLKGAISTGRNVPDLSFDADPATGASWFAGGSFLGPFGGTSLSSPIFGAALTQMNEQAGSRSGFVNPRFYAAFKKLGYVRAGTTYFRDITYGSNGAFTATPGFDQVTGIGAPMIDAIAAGPKASSTLVRLAVGLRPRDPAGLDALVKAQSDPASPLFRHFLTQAQLRDNFSPPMADYERAIADLRGRGFVVARTSPLRLGFDVLAPSSLVEQTFATHVRRVATASNVVAYAASVAPTIPETLRSSVTSIAGLAGAPSLRAAYGAQRRPSHRVSSSTNASAGKVPFYGPDGGYGPAALIASFGFPVAHGYDGRGVRVADIIDGEFSDKNDVAPYLSYFGVKRTGPHTTLHLIDGGCGGIVFCGPDSFVAASDVEGVLGVAPGVGYDLYELPDTTNVGIIDGFAKVLDDDRADIVNFSLAGCEFSFGEAALQVDEVAEFGAALGMTFETIALGGANACGLATPTVAAPADSPSVLAVGGADAFTDAAGALTRVPIVNALTGGGTSVVFPEPSWQRGARGTSTAGRNVPDIVGPADVNGVGPSIYFLDYGWDGGSEMIDNAPVAGGLAEIAQIQKGRLGLVAPSAFKLYKSGNPYKYGYFLDVTRGCNGVGPGFPYCAKTGYDFPSGLGTPDFYKLAPKL